MSQPIKHTLKIISSVTPKNELNKPCPKCDKDNKSDTPNSTGNGRYPFGFCAEVENIFHIQDKDQFDNPIGDPRKEKHTLWHCPSCGHSDTKIEIVKEKKEVSK